MRHQPAEGGRIRRGVDGQDDPVGAGIRPGVHGAARQDGELVQVAAGAVGEGEAFAVVVGVGVLAPPWAGCQLGGWTYRGGGGGGGGRRRGGEIWRD